MSALPNYELHSYYSFLAGMFPVGTTGRSLSTNNEDEAVDSTFALGELAQLTVNNDVENSYDVSKTEILSIYILCRCHIHLIYMQIIRRWHLLKNHTGKHGMLNIRYVVILMALEH